jgi:hypothetical protein
MSLLSFQQQYNAWDIETVEDKRDNKTPVGVNQIHFHKTVVDAFYGKGTGNVWYEYDKGNGDEHLNDVMVELVQTKNTAINFILKAGDVLQKQYAQFYMKGAPSLEGIVRSLETLVINGLKIALSVLDKFVNNQMDVEDLAVLLYGFVYDHIVGEITWQINDAVGIRTQNAGYLKYKEETYLPAVRAGTLDDVVKKAQPNMVDPLYKLFSSIDKDGKVTDPGLVAKGINQTAVMFQVTKDNDNNALLERVFPREDTFKQALEVAWQNVVRFAMPEITRMAFEPIRNSINDQYYIKNGAIDDKELQAIQNAFMGVARDTLLEFVDYLYKDNNWTVVLGKDPNISVVGAVENVLTERLGTKVKELSDITGKNYGALIEKGKRPTTADKKSYVLSESATLDDNFVVTELQLRIKDKEVKLYLKYNEDYEGDQDIGDLEETSNDEFVITAKANASSVMKYSDVTKEVLILMNSRHKAGLFIKGFYRSDGPMKVEYENYKKTLPQPQLAQNEHIQLSTAARAGKTTQAAQHRKNQPYSRIAATTTLTNSLGDENSGQLITRKKTVSQTISHTDKEEANKNSQITKTIQEFLVMDDIRPADEDRFDEFARRYYWKIFYPLAEKSDAVSHPSMRDVQKLATNFAAYLIERKVAILSEDIIIKFAEWYGYQLIMDWKKNLDIVEIVNRYNKDVSRTFRTLSLTKCKQALLRSFQAFSAQKDRVDNSITGEKPMDRIKKRAALVPYQDGSIKSVKIVENKDGVPSSFTPKKIRKNTIATLKKEAEKLGKLLRTKQVVLAMNTDPYKVSDTNPSQKGMAIANEPIVVSFKDPPDNQGLLDMDSVWIENAILALSMPYQATDNNSDILKQHEQEMLKQTSAKETHKDGIELKYPDDMNPKSKSGTYTYTDLSLDVNADLVRQRAENGERLTSEQLIALVYTLLQTVQGYIETAEKSAKSAEADDTINKRQLKIQTKPVAPKSTATSEEKEEYEMMAKIYEEQTLILPDTSADKQLFEKLQAVVYHIHKYRTAEKTNSEVINGYDPEVTVLLSRIFNNETEVHSFAAKYAAIANAKTVWVYRAVVLGWTRIVHERVMQQLRHNKHRESVQGTLQLEHIGYHDDGYESYDSDTDAPSTGYIEDTYKREAKAAAKKAVSGDSANVKALNNLVDQYTRVSTNINKILNISLIATQAQRYALLIKHKRVFRNETRGIGERYTKSIEQGIQFDPVVDACAKDYLMIRERNGIVVPPVFVAAPFKNFVEYDIRKTQHAVNRLFRFVDNTWKELKLNVPVYVLLEKIVSQAKTTDGNRLSFLFALFRRMLRRKGIMFSGYDAFAGVELQIRKAHDNELVTTIIDTDTDSGMDRDIVRKEDDLMVNGVELRGRKGEKASANSIQLDTGTIMDIDSMEEDLDLSDMVGDHAKSLIDFNLHNEQTLIDMWYMNYLSRDALFMLDPSGGDVPKVPVIAVSKFRREYESVLLNIEEMLKVIDKLENTESKTFLEEFIGRPFDVDPSNKEFTDTLESLVYTTVCLYYASCASWWLDILVATIPAKSIHLALDLEKMPRTETSVFGQMDQKRGLVIDVSKGFNGTEQNYEDIMGKLAPQAWTVGVTAMAHLDAYTRGTPKPYVAVSHAVRQANFWALLLDPFAYRRSVFKFSEAKVRDWVEANYDAEYRDLILTFRNDTSKTISNQEVEALFSEIEARSVLTDDEKTRQQTMTDILNSSIKWTENKSIIEKIRKLMDRIEAHAEELSRCLAEYRDFRKYITTRDSPSSYSTKKEQIIYELVNVCRDQIRELERRRRLKNAFFHIMKKNERVLQQVKTHSMLGSDIMDEAAIQHEISELAHSVGFLYDRSTDTVQERIPAMSRDRFRDISFYSCGAAPQFWKLYLPDKVIDDVDTENHNVLEGVTVKFMVKTIMKANRIQVLPPDEVPIADTIEAAVAISNHGYEKGHYEDDTSSDVTRRALLQDMTSMRSVFDNHRFTEEGREEAIGALLWAKIVPSYYATPIDPKQLYSDISTQPLQIWVGTTSREKENRKHEFIRDFMWDVSQNEKVYWTKPKKPFPLPKWALLPAAKDDYRDFETSSGDVISITSALVYEKYIWKPYIEDLREFTAKQSEVDRILRSSAYVSKRELLETLHSKREGYRYIADYEKPDILSKKEWKEQPFPSYYIQEVDTNGDVVAFHEVFAEDSNDYKEYVTSTYLRASHERVIYKKYEEKFEKYVREEVQKENGIQNSLDEYMFTVRTFPMANELMTTKAKRVRDGNDQKQVKGKKSSPVDRTKFEPKSVSYHFNSNAFDFTDTGGLDTTVCPTKHEDAISMSCVLESFENFPLYSVRAAQALPMEIPKHNRVGQMEHVMDSVQALEQLMTSNDIYTCWALLCCLDEPKTKNLITMLHRNYDSIIDRYARSGVAGAEAVCRLMVRIMIECNFFERGREPLIRTMKMTFTHVMARRHLLRMFVSMIALSSSYHEVKPGGIIPRKTVGDLDEQYRKKLIELYIANYDFEHAEDFMDESDDVSITDTPDKITKARYREEEDVTDDYVVKIVDNDGKEVEVATTKVHIIERALGIDYDWGNDVSFVTSMTAYSHALLTWRCYAGTPIDASSTRLLDLFIDCYKFWSKSDQRSVHAYLVDEMLDEYVRAFHTVHSLQEIKKTAYRLCYIFNEPDRSATDSIIEDLTDMGERDWRLGIQNPGAIKLWYIYKIEWSTRRHMPSWLMYIVSQDTKLYRQFPVRLDFSVSRKISQIHDELSENVSIRSGNNVRTAAHVFDDYIFKKHYTENGENIVKALDWQPRNYIEVFTPAPDYLHYHIWCTNKQLTRDYGVFDMPQSAIRYDYVPRSLKLKNALSKDTKSILSADASVEVAKLLVIAYHESTILLARIQAMISSNTHNSMIEFTNFIAAAIYFVKWWSKQYYQKIVKRKMPDLDSNMKNDLKKIPERAQATTYTVLLQEASEIFNTLKLSMDRLYGILTQRFLARPKPDELGQLLSILFDGYSVGQDARYPFSNPYLDKAPNKKQLAQALSGAGSPHELRIVYDFINFEKYSVQGHNEKFLKSNSRLMPNEDGDFSDVDYGAFVAYFKDFSNDKEGLVKKMRFTIMRKNLNFVIATMIFKTVVNFRLEFTGQNSINPYYQNQLRERFEKEYTSELDRLFTFSKFATTLY